MSKEKTTPKGWEREHRGRFNASKLRKTYRNCNESCKNAFSVINTVPWVVETPTPTIQF